MNYLAVRSRFASQGLVSSHELRQAFPDFDKRRLVEWQARGYLTQKRGIETPADLLVQLLAHCQTLDMQAMADDVRPFLFNPREDRLVTLFPQYIQQVLS